ncbi:hypothetical protein CspeluHIS016_0403780 [Cutaneotrichosporon spelunceum]|uniref:Yeast cell wall synthesis Kre9/Knh1-like N-terminal domain-containing protein n=1 Tax=Cutaneotrichosporon spelunceum TaxID=1672016 RepID=A0AAD3TW02_9TREE|nr:hypothetical protein CspeluHIS016_0403780 [Cutaneotrichosporon spelunceum]
MLAATILLFAAAVRAIQITAPANGTVWKSGEAQTISWSSVNTDPSEFTIAVQIQEPFSTQEIVKVETSAGSYSWTPSASLVGTDYRINFLNPKDNGILAQSGYFAIEQGSTVVSSAVPNASANGAGALVPSLALVAGSLAALLA